MLQSIHQTTLLFQLKLPVLQQLLPTPQKLQPPNKQHTSKRYGLLQVQQERAFRNELSPNLNNANAHLSTRQNPVPFLQENRAPPKSVLVKPKLS